MRSSNLSYFFRTLLVLALPACGDISVAGQPSGAAGESCTKKADCGDGLQCVSNICTDPTPATDGEAATDATDGEAATDATDGEAATDATDQGTTDTTDGTVETPTGCGGETCPAEASGDGVCQRECNCAELSFDGGECLNQCTGEAERAVWDVPGYELQPGDCWQGCAGDPELTTCTDTCLQNAGLAAPCSLCFATFIDCFATNCGEPCVDTPAESACDACSTAHCWPAFYTCGGAIGTPQ